jgi:hypothetical protein
VIRPSVRAQVNLNALRELGIPEELIALAQRKNDAVNERQARRRNREVSFMVQSDILGREIRECFFEDTKRGERGGGGRGSDHKRNEALRRKVVQYAIRQRAWRSFD